MNRFIIKTAFALALPLASFAGIAQADANADTLIAACKKSEPKPETCECQVNALVENADARYVQVLAAIMANEAAMGDPAAAEKVMADALAAAGLTAEEFEKLGTEAEAKVGPAMEACKAG